MLRRSRLNRSGSSLQKKAWTLSTLEKRLMLAGDVGAAAAARRFLFSGGDCVRQPDSSIGKSDPLFALGDYRRERGD